MTLMLTYANKLPIIAEKMWVQEVIETNNQWIDNYTMCSFTKKHTVSDITAHKQRCFHDLDFLWKSRAAGRPGMLKWGAEPRYSGC